MRIVGGEFRGRRLSGPKSDRIRPTSDRVRESLFNILSGMVDLERQRVIDLFAGTGALGIEALSRGASFALFVEDGVEGRALLRQNIESLALAGRTKIFRRDATRLGPRGHLAPFSLAFLDPPYSRELGGRAIDELVSNDWLTSDAMVVLEEKRDAISFAPEGLREIDRRNFGDTAIAFYARS